MSDHASADSPAAPPDKGGVHRLVDMLVEEVSLVDRPANKQRFLVVKMELEMPRKKTEEKKTPAAKTETPVAAPSPEEAAKAKKPPKKPEDEETEKAKKMPPAEDPPEEEEEEPPTGKKASKAFPPKKKDPDEEEEEDQEDEPDDAPAAEDKPTGKKPPRPAAKDENGAPEPGAPDDEAADDAETPLAVALAALDSLTQAVEILSSSPDDGSQLASVAQDIKAAADAISTAAGIEADEEEEEGEGPDASIAGLVSSIQEMLTKIDSLTQALSASSRPPPAPPTSTTETQAPPDLAGTLAEVAQSMKSLDASVKAQATRLETLEKRAGLPNSQPAGERVTKSHPEDETSWPVDMNRPRDRASVDKSTSFHDV